MLIGRSEQLGLLAGHIEQGQGVVVTGEAGIGKTSLAREAVAAAGLVALEGGGVATLSFSPYLPLRRALPGAVRPGPAEVMADDVAGAVGEAVLVLDDMQWADSHTRDLIPLLAQRLRLLVAVRLGEPHSEAVLDEAARAGLARTDLCGLEEADAGALVRRLRPDLDAATRRGVVARAGGNPFFLEELARDPEGTAVLHLMLDGRLQALSEQGAEDVLLLGLLGRGAPPALLAARDELLAAGLVVWDGPDLALRHALFGEAAVERAPEGRTRATHARIAAALDDAAERARHLAAADDRQAALAAARVALGGTLLPGERASHLELAASVAEGEERTRLQLEAADAVLSSDRPWHAVAIAEAVISDDPEVAAQVQRVVAAASVYVGDRERAARAVADGLALVDGTGSRTEVLLRLEEVRLRLFVDFDIPAAFRLGGDALALATEAGVEMHRARYMLGAAHVYTGSQEWRPLLEAAAAGARAAGDTETQFQSALGLAFAHALFGDPEEARRVAEAGGREATGLALPVWERDFRAVRVLTDAQRGDYGDALAGAPVALEGTRSRTGVIFARGGQALALVDLGRDDAATRVAAEWSEEAVAASDDLCAALAAWLRAEAHYWGGRPGDAVAVVDAALVAVPHLAPMLAWGQVVRAWARHDLGEDPALTGPVLAHGGYAPVPVEVAGVEALHAGDFTTARDRFSEAAALWAPYFVRGELRCLWAAGEARRRHGDVAGACEVLGGVEERARALLMKPLHDRALASLRHLGVRRPPLGTGRAETGVLSSRERETLLLVADGLTHAEIAARLGVSASAVNKTIAAAVSRLGAANRLEAVSLLLGAGGE